MTALGVALVVAIIANVATAGFLAGAFPSEAGDE